MKLVRISTIGASLVIAALAATPSSAVTVLAGSSAPTLLGAVVAGQHYTVTATGIATLCGSCDLGQPISFTPEGVPTSPPNPSGPYATFWPNGLDHDPSAGPGSYGPAGAGINVGALVGTFTPGSNFFLLGSSYSFTAASTGILYGLVNDSYYPDNSNGFNVTLAQSAVPEPATWAMMLGGFGLMGGAMRYRRRQARISYTTA
jgi:hypothetical protein